jgi:hypothetical protein
MAHQIWVLPAFSLVAKNRLVRKCSLWSAVIVRAGKAVLLVKHTRVLPEVQSVFSRILRGLCNFSCAVASW